MSNQYAPVQPKRSFFSRFLALVVGATLLSVAGGTGFIVGRQSVDGVEGLDEIEQVIQRDALKVPDEKTLNDGALRGAVAALDDQYASWYSAEEFSRFSSQLDGKFVGIGVFLERTNLGMLITNVVPNSPAEAAGLKAGEYIVEVDGKRLRASIPFEEMHTAIIGEEGTEVSLLISSPAGESKPYTITRKKFDLPLTQTNMMEHGVAQVRLLEFSRNAGSELEKAIDAVKAQGAKGVVLDLRSNPGGLLDESIKVMELFVKPKTKVVSIESRHDKEELFTGDAQPKFGDLPMVVLVNEYSASASEIVAAAIQEHGRAKIIGHQTFGKGVVQTVVNLEGGTGMKLTTARYLTPNGESINEIGVSPDVAITAEPDRVLKEAAQYLAENELGVAPPGN